MIGTIAIKINAAHPNISLQPLISFINSPSSIRIIDIPKKIGKWTITEVYLQVNYPDNSITTKQAVLVGGCYVVSIDGCDTAGKSYNGYTIIANGTDENGNDISGYVLGKGDIIILDTDSSIVIDGKSYYLHLMDNMPDNPNKADVVYNDDTWMIYDGNDWVDFSLSDNAIRALMSDYTYSKNETDSKLSSIQSAVDSQGDRINIAETQIEDLEQDAFDTKQDIQWIYNVIPPQATNQNPLADKNFVNSSIATNTANFKGTFSSVDDLPLSDVTNNDYAFVVTKDESGNTVYKRYKYSTEHTAWEYEYTLNNTGFTAAQWTTINCGVVSSDITQIENNRQAIVDIYNMIDGLENEIEGI